jgi:hypothetical protein
MHVTFTIYVIRELSRIILVLPLGSTPNSLTTAKIICRRKLMVVLAEVKNLQIKVGELLFSREK